MEIICIRYFQQMSKTHIITNCGGIPRNKGAGVLQELFEQIGAQCPIVGAGLAIQWPELLYICFRNLDEQHHSGGLLSTVMKMGLNIE